MVVMDLEQLLLYDRGVRPNAHDPHFVVIDETHHLFRLRDKYSHAINPCAPNFTPVGFVLCAELACGRLSRILRDDFAVCELGHVSDPKTEGRLREDGKKCKVTTVGLSLTDQGRLGEMAVFSYKGDLGPYGRIVKIAKGYRSPLDCLTSLGRGVEIKSMTTRARAIRFDPGLQKYRKTKWDAIKEQGLLGGLGLQVILDLDDPTSPKAYLHAEAMDDGWRIFYPSRANLVAVIDLTDVLPKFVAKYKIKPRCDKIDPRTADELIALPENFDVDELIEKILNPTPVLAPVAGSQNEPEPEGIPF